MQGFQAIDFRILELSGFPHYATGLAEPLV